MTANDPNTDPEEGRVVAQEALRGAEAFFLVTVRQRTGEEAASGEIKTEFVTDIVRGGFYHLAPQLLSGMLNGGESFCEMFQNAIIKNGGEP